MDVANNLRKVRRYIASFSLAMLVASFFTVGAAQAQTFTDVPPGNWPPYDAIEALAAKGVLNKSFSTFRWSDTANRAETAVMVAKAFNIDPVMPATPTFTDVPKDHFAFGYIEALAAKGVVSGYAGTTKYGPADAVTREQYAKIVVDAAPLTYMFDGTSPFSDVKDTSWWSYKYVLTAYRWSVVDGYSDGSYKPTNPINRAEIANMTYKALSPVLRTDDGTPVEGFAIDDVYATADNMIEVCYTEMPGESAMMMDNYMITNEAGDELAISDVMASDDDMCVTLKTATQTEGESYDLMISDVMSEAGDELNGEPSMSFTGYMALGTGGDLTCTAGQQPKGVSVPQGSSGVEMLIVNCSAASDDVVITGMSFHRIGSGDESDLADVYLYADGQRMTSGRSVNSENDMVEFSGVNKKVPANDTVSFMVVADIENPADAASQHGFELVDMADVDGNASSVDGDFPVKGELFTISGNTAADVTITKNGSLNELSIGQHGQIAEFKIDVNGNEDVNLERLALYIRGTCDADGITNLELKAINSDEVLATADSVGAKDLATFDLENPYLIDNDTVFEVWADVVCENGETIKSYLDETTDLLAKGVNTKVGVMVTNNYGSANASEVTVKGANFNVASNNPSYNEIAVGQDQVSCLNLTLTNSSNSPVYLEDWKMKIEVVSPNPVAVNGANGLLNATSQPNYNDFKLVQVDDSGKIVKTLLSSGQLASVGDQTQDVDLDGTQAIDSLKSVKAQLVFDVENNTSLNGDKIKCTLYSLASDAVGGGERVLDVNDDALTSDEIAPSSNIVGKELTLSAANLTFTVAQSIHDSRSYVTNAKDVVVLGLSVKGGSSLDTTIKKLSLQGYIDAENGAAPTGYVATADGAAVLRDTIDSLELLVNDEVVSLSPESVNSDTGKVNFQNLAIKVPKSGEVKLKLRGDINGQAPNGAADYIKFAIAATADITAIDQNGKTVTLGASSISNAANGGAGVPGASDVFAKITRGGSGTVVNSSGSESSAKLLAQSEEKVLGKFKFDATDEDVKVQDLTFGAFSTKGLSAVKLYRESDNQLFGPASGVSSVNGVVSFNDIELTVTDTTPVTLIARGTTNEVTSGKASSGDAIGLALLDVVEVESSSGTNISEKFVGTNPSFGTLNTALAGGVAKYSLAAATTFSANLPANGNVVVVGNEQMLVLTGGTTATGTLMRGFTLLEGNDDVPGHSSGDAAYVSTLGILGSTVNEGGAFGAVDTTLTVTSGTSFKAGDVIFLASGAVNGDGTAPEYMLVSAVVGNNLTVVRGLYGTTAASHADAQVVTRFPFGGKVSTLRKNVPLFTNVTLPTGSLGSANLKVMEFVLSAKGPGGVNFKNLQGNSLTFNTAGTMTGAATATCTLKDETGQALDTATAVANLMVFDFATSDLVVPASDTNGVTLRVECNTSAAAADQTFTLSLTDANYGDDSLLNNVDTTLYEDKFPITGTTFNTF